MTNTEIEKICLIGSISKLESEIKYRLAEIQTLCSFEDVRILNKNSDLDDTADKLEAQIYNLRQLNSVFKEKRKALSNIEEQEKVFQHSNQSTL